MMCNPFFIIGNPRSGTTLLRLMLTNNKDLLVPPECGFAVWLYSKYAEANFLQLETLKKFVDDVHASRKFDTWNIQKHELFESLAKSEPKSYMEAVASVYLCYGQTLCRTFKRWGDKNNYYLHHISELNEIFPKAQFIHIIRDGRDVACSYREVNRKFIDNIYAPKLPDNIVSITEEWRNNINEITRSLSNLGNNMSTEVRFTDLVMMPEKTLQRLSSFLGVEYDSSMLNYHVVNKKRKLEPEKFIAWKEKTLLPPQHTTIGRYIKDLSSDEIETFESIAGDILQKYKFI